MKLIPVASKQAPEKLRTYDMTTIAGTTVAIVQLGAPLLGLVYSGIRIADNIASAFDYALIVGCVLILIVISVPMWFNWIMKMSNDRREETIRANAISAKTIETELLIDLENAKMETVKAIRMLSNLQVEYALTLHELPLFSIDGKRVSWNLEGVAIPVSFAVEWWEAKAKREQNNTDQLPAQSDWNHLNGIRREQAREHNKAITTALVKMGMVSSASSKYPPRWVTYDQHARNKALDDIGFFIAYGIAESELSKNT